MRYWLTWLLVTCLYVTLCCQSGAPAYPVPKEKSNLELLSKPLGYRLDTAQVITPDIILKEIAKLELIPGKTIHKASNDAHWFVFDLKKKESDKFDNYILQISNAHLSHYDLYAFMGDLEMKHVTQGDKYPISTREILHNHFIHPLPNVASNYLTILIKANNEGQELSLPIKIISLNSHLKENSNLKLFHGFIIGLFLVTALITLILFFIYRERYFLWETSVSIFSVLYILAEEGYGMMLFWPNSPWMNGVSRPLFFMLVVISGLLFTLEFLRKDHWPKLWTWITYGSIGIISLYAILIHPLDALGLKDVDNYASIILILLVMCFLLCILTLAITLRSWIKDKSMDGMVIFLVFVATAISLLFRIFAIQGYGQNNQLLEHTGFITRGIHVPLIGGYLLYRVIVDNQRRVKERLQLLEAQQRSSQAIIENIDNERQRISMALHDSVGSIATGIKSNLQMIATNDNSNSKLLQSLTLTEKLQDEIRNICNDILPNTISKMGIIPEVKRLLQTIEKTYNIKTTLQTNVTTKQSVSDNILIHIYYIIRESLDNAVKYANCTNILIQYYHYVDDEIHLLIEDDGDGFDQQTAWSTDNTNGNGLKNMILRVSWLNGTIDIYSKDGTSISINIPLTQDI